MTKCLQKVLNTDLKKHAKYRLYIKKTLQICYYFIKIN